VPRIQPTVPKFGGCTPPTLRGGPQAFDPELPRPGSQAPSHARLRGMEPFRDGLWEFWERAPRTAGGEKLGSEADMPGKGVVDLVDLSHTQILQPRLNLSRS
jgi:hypothetical protein